MKIGDGEWRASVCEAVGRRSVNRCVFGLGGATGSSAASPAAFCSVFVSTKTSHPITNVVHYGGGGVRAGVLQ